VVLDGNLIRYLKKEDRNSRAYEVASLASKNLEDVLGTGETSSIQIVTRFWAKVLESERLFDGELQRIRSTSLAKLPENARRFLAPEAWSEVSPQADISDLSQTVEVRQFARLLQSCWKHYHEDELDANIFESVRAFGKGFKNLDFAASSGEETRFSEEYYDGNLRQGETVVVDVPPVIWRLGDRLRVIVKGIARPKS
jgi:hypothetical protein